MSNEKVSPLFVREIREDALLSLVLVVLLDLFAAYLEVIEAGVGMCLFI